MHKYFRDHTESVNNGNNFTMARQWYLLIVKFLKVTQPRDKVAQLLLFIFNSMGLYDPFCNIRGTCKFMLMTFRCTKWVHTHNLSLLRVWCVDAG